MPPVPVPIGQNDPRGQSCGAIVLIMGLHTYPGGHKLHTEAPARFMKKPDEHGTGTELPTAQLDPIVQRSGEAVPGGQKYPPKQRRVANTVPLPVRYIIHHTRSNMHIIYTALVKREVILRNIIQHTISDEIAMYDADFATSLRTRAVETFHAWSALID